MYRLTPRMLQHFTVSLGKYHDLFMGGRCSGWELEELLVAAIKSDTQAQHHARWKEGGHDDEADITVTANGRDSHRVMRLPGQAVIQPRRYNDTVKTTIGLRLQPRLTTDQAKDIAACQSAHRDISLDF